MSVEWDYFDKFNDITEKYLPRYGEGETKATQIVTAVCKLVYKWYNDGDVYDNTRYMEGWCNDLSDLANWLHKHTPAKSILERIYQCYTESDYEDLLKDLVELLIDENYLKEMNTKKKIGTIYKCIGKFEFVDQYDEDDEEDY